jgi:hypothetical protein
MVVVGAGGTVENAKRFPKRRWASGKPRGAGRWPARGGGLARFSTCPRARQCPQCSRPPPSGSGQAVPESTEPSLVAQPWPGPRAARPQGDPECCLARCTMMKSLRTGTGRRKRPIGGRQEAQTLARSGCVDTDGHLDSSVLLPTPDVFALRDTVVDEYREVRDLVHDDPRVHEDIKAQVEAIYARGATGPSRSSRSTRATSATPTVEPRGSRRSRPGTAQTSSKRRARRSPSTSTRSRPSRSPRLARATSSRPAPAQASRSASSSRSSAPSSREAQRAAKHARGRSSSTR